MNDSSKIVPSKLLNYLPKLGFIKNVNIHREEHKLHCLNNQLTKCFNDSKIIQI